MFCALDLDALHSVLGEGGVRISSNEKVCIGHGSLLDANPGCCLVKKNNNFRLSNIPFHPFFERHGVERQDCEEVLVGTCWCCCSALLFGIVVSKGISLPGIYFCCVLLLLLFFYLFIFFFVCFVFCFYWGVACFAAAPVGFRVTEEGIWRAGAGGRGEGGNRFLVRLRKIFHRSSKIFFRIRKFF